MVRNNLPGNYKYTQLILEHKREKESLKSNYSLLISKLWTYTWLRCENLRIIIMYYEVDKNVFVKDHI